MKKTMLTICLTLCLTLLAAVLFVGCGGEKDVTENGGETLPPAKVVAKTADYALSVVDDLNVGDGDWVVFTLARCGRDVPQEVFDTYYQRLEAELVANGGVIPDAMPSVYARMALLVTALGHDPGNVGGYDLFAPLNNVAEVEGQGVNGPSWALIAAKGCGGSVPEEEYLSFIKDNQREDGGFSIAATGASDSDITAMILQSLSFYREDAEIAAVIEEALTFLSSVQQEDGGFATMGTASSESCSQVLTALAGLGISLDDERFVKNGNSVYDALMTYYRDDCTFAHVKDVDESDAIATTQGFYAVVALDRMEKGESFLYDLTK